MFASFVVFINEVFSAFNANGLPGIKHIYYTIPSFYNIRSNLTFFKFKYFKFSSIKLIFSELYSRLFSQDVIVGNRAIKGPEDTLADQYINKYNNENNKDNNNPSSYNPNNPSSYNPNNPSSYNPNNPSSYNPNNILVRGGPIDRLLSERASRLRESRHETRVRRFREGRIRNMSLRSSNLEHGDITR